MKNKKKLVYIWLFIQYTGVAIYAFGVAIYAFGVAIYAFGLFLAQAGPFQYNISVFSLFWVGWMNDSFQAV